MRNKIAVIMVLLIVVPFSLFALTFGFNHRVGASNEPYVIMHSPEGGVLPTTEEGTSVEFSSDGAAFQSIAVIGMRYEEAFSISRLNLTFGSFSSPGGSTCPYAIRFIDPHSDSNATLRADLTQPGSVVLYSSGYQFKQYLTSENYYTDSLVTLAVKADTQHLAHDSSGAESVIYSLSVIIEVVFP